MIVADRLGLPDARLIPTPAFMTVDGAVQRAQVEPGVVILHGPTGTGKRTAIDYWADRHHVASERLAFANPPDLWELSDRLASLVLADTSRRNLIELQQKVIAKLGVEPRPIWINPDQMTAAGVRLIRYIWEESGAGWPVLITCSDPGSARVANDGVPLDNAHVIRFRTLTKPEVITWIPGYHPMYNDAPDQWLVFIDDRYAHGLLSRWKTFTRSMTRLAAQEGSTGRITSRLINAVLERLDHAA